MAKENGKRGISAKWKYEMKRSGRCETRNREMCMCLLCVYSVHTFILLIRAMSFSRFDNSQFDAFVSNFVHDFNWFLIRSIYVCDVSSINWQQIILVQWLFHWLPWYDLNTLILKELSVKCKMILCCVRWPNSFLYNFVRFILSSYKLYIYIYERA